MSNSVFDSVYNPDVLSCLANLSNDEVFTPPEIANQMIDMLPQELFSDSNATFLDPACKSGVFLREITKRLIIGLKDKIPDLQARIDHILHKQVYGIAITELTSYLSRRSLYCSKFPNGKYSVSKFDSKESQGHVLYKEIEHTFKDGTCLYCGASEKTFGKKERKDLESHAYQFIHTHKPEEIFNMKFDVIIGNPPYQLDDGGAQASAKPIYQLFIQSAIKLRPRYLTMIVPSRWFAGGKGLDDFRAQMLHDERLSIIHDFPNASDCFQGVDIKGGVNYFLWTRDHKGDCEIYTHEGDKIVSHAKRPLLEKGCSVFIRNNNLVSVFKKVSAFREPSFKEIVSPRKPYGLSGDFFKNPQKYGLPSVSESPIADGYTIYGLDSSLKRVKRYVSKDYPLPRHEMIGDYKMFMARNQGSGIFGETFTAPVFAGPGELCTETFVVIGLFKTKEECMNCWSYIKTKFFRAMVGVKKNDQGAAQGVYEYVPLQDWSHPWTDEMLYEKYKLSDDEIKFIEENVKLMEE